MALTPKQQQFVDYYLADPNLNATAAYRRAYPACKSDEAAGAAAARLLGSARVQEAITGAMAARGKKLKVDAEWVLRRLIRNANRAAKAGNFAAVNRALELVGKHIGMFAEKHEHAGPGGGPIQLEHSGEVAVKAALDEYDSVFREIEAEAGAGAPVLGDGAAEPVAPAGPDAAAGAVPR